MIHSINSDGTKAVITVAAQRIAAYADRQHIPVEQAQCEELAEDLMHVYQAFFAGFTHGSRPPDWKTTPTD